MLITKEAMDGKLKLTMSGYRVNDRLFIKGSYPKPGRPSTWKVYAFWTLDGAGEPQDGMDGDLPDGMGDGVEVMTLSTVEQLNHLIAATA